ncbi:MAG: 1-acyl-sn-glycerol-3-phosphate acyltransferase [Cyclobacteriaceae bacterium]
MIKATRSEWLKKAFYHLESKVFLPRTFKKIEITEIPVKPGHSVLLLQNQFSWWDGFIGSYLAYRFLNKSYHVMVQEDQLRQRPYFRFKGAYSIRKKSRELFESLHYTAEVLKDPNNMVLVFPQGRLQSIYTENIEVEKGIFKLLELLPKNCQIIYNAVEINFFESFKPSVHCHLLDCGTTDELRPEDFREKISAFHKEAMRHSIRK